MAHLEGYVSHIRFHNEDNGYTVMEIETTHGDEVLVGNFHYINEGEYICAEGEYVDPVSYTHLTLPTICSV